MNIIDLVINVAILFIMMVPGVIMKKCKLCTDVFGKGISNLVLYIAQTCLIVYAYLSCDASFSDIWLGCLMTFFLSFLAHIIFTAVAIPVFRKAPDGACRMLRFATIFSNAAFMDIPLIQAIIPDPTAAIYASIYNITFNLFLWTLGVKLCTDGLEHMRNDEDCDCHEQLSGAKAVSIKKVIFHPVTLASVIGLLLLILGVNNATLSSAHLGIISDSLLMLKNLVAPLSMVVIGLRLAELDLHGFFKDVYMYVFLILRHLALPIATVGVMELLSLFLPISDTVELVIAIMVSAPAATSATMFAEKYDCDAPYVSRLVTVSTILCIATMPLIVMLVQLW
ncbi:MAG: AEC family transporter [Clostridia bacterium]|nr:AEC family transporter [Clostridia bacterium]MBQ7391020.1 AEC family transporter [Clostridia bacterium]